jgi:hypothetical protein
MLLILKVNILDLRKRVEEPLGFLFIIGLLIN